MIAKDNREFLDQLEKAGEAIRIKQEVDWDCEAGAIVRRACEIGAPAPFFQKIKDYPGHRMAGGLLSTPKRIAILLGMDPNSSIRQLIDEFAERKKNRIKPVLVKDAPCQQNVAMGKDVNLSMFPIPMVHDGDGGRYITWHALINKDPDTGWVNWGMYRDMVHNEHLVGCLALPHSDAGRIMAKYEWKGEGMPFAIAIGLPPACAFTAACSLGAGVSEVEVAGALQGEPVELVKCKTVDLEVPAYSEIVLEGHVLPGVLVDEGPFGEYTGFRASPRSPRSVWQVECITWQDDPIMTMSNMGVPIDEGQLVYGTISLSAAYKEALQAAGIPVTGVYVPPEGCSWIVIVSVMKVLNEIAAWIASVLNSHRIGMGAISLIIVVDHTVDPFNIGEVMHAVSGRLHPLKGHFTIPGIGSPLAPFLSLQERMSMRGGKLILDATWPLEWDPETEKPTKMSFNETYPPELQEKVLDNWQKYGYK